MKRLWKPWLCLAFLLITGALVLFAQSHRAKIKVKQIGSPELQEIKVGMTENEVEAIFGGSKGSPFAGDVGGLRCSEHISIEASDIHSSKQWKGSDGLLIVDFDKNGKVIGRRFFYGNLF